jgi:hypothetical protein
VIYNPYQVMVAGSVPVQSASGKTKLQFASRVRSTRRRYVHGCKRCVRKIGDAEQCQIVHPAQTKHSAAFGRSKAYSGPAIVPSRKAGRDPERAFCPRTFRGRPCPAAGAGLIAAVLRLHAQSGFRFANRSLTEDGGIAFGPHAEAEICGCGTSSSRLDSVAHKM